MSASENNLQAKNWLVKSSMKILGPFTREEIIGLLTRRQITIIDEIRQPDSRWNYVRENRYFKEIVKNLRYEDDHSREDTMTSTATVGTITITKTDAPLVPDDFTPTPVTPHLAPPEKPLLRDVTPSPNGTNGTLRPNGGTAAKSFGNLQDQRVQNKIQSQNVALRGLLVVIFLATLAMLGYGYFQKGKKSDLSYDQLMAAALRYKEIGLYQKSLEFYKKAAAIHEVDLENQFQMAFPLINEDRQSLQGRRIIEKALLKENRTRQEVIAGNLGIGLSYMMEGDLRQAEDALQKTLGLDSTNEAAKINLAVILLKKGNYTPAMRSFEALSRGDSPGYPLILLGKTIALIELSKINPETENMRRGMNEIKAYIGRSHLLHKELSMLLVYLNHLAKDSVGELDSMNTFMDEPLGLTPLYSKDLRLDWRNGDWDFLERYCNELYTAAKSVPNIKALRAVCLLQGNREMEATKLIDEVLAQAPKQLSSVQLQASLLTKLGRVNEAQILFQNSEFKNTRLALYTQGDNCLKNRDFACAEASYKTLVQRDFGDVVAHHGLAQSALGQNDRVRAQSEVKAGFEAETNFAPLIELRDKLESP